jgi:FkbM family methyltransferase
MNGQAETFELSLSTPGEPIRFYFTSGGERDHIALLARAHGLVNYEAPTPVVFAGLLREAPGLFLDIGANTGIFALLAAASDEHVRVFAFEPLEPARQLLHTNIACNAQLAPRILVAPLALSRSRAVLPFFETINDRGLISTSSSLKIGHAIGVGAYVQREIATETLDDWVEASGEGPIQLMKIDVEGHEDAVLEGGRRTIERQRPIIVVEVLGPADFSALNAFLAAHDYRDFALSPTVLRGCSTIRFHPDAWNHLLCPAEKVDLVSMVCQRLELCFEKPTLGQANFQAALW